MKVALSSMLADNDKPVVSISGQTNVNEAVGEVEYTISLSNPSDTDTVVDVVITDGSAQQGEDYSEPTTTQVTIPAGETQATINVPIVNDDTFEGSEDYTVTVDKIVSGDATIGSDDSVNTIINDDGTGRLTDVTLA